MMQRIALAMAGLAILSAAAADDTASLVGNWKLTSRTFEFKDGSAALAQHPSGYLILTAQGRMMAFIEDEGRSVPKSEADAAAAFRSMTAYTGRYTVSGTTWTTKVDGAWNPAWKGSEQVREFKLKGDHLDVVTMWQPQVNFDGKTGRAVLSWERAK